MGNPSWYPDFIDKDPCEFTLADWGLAYRVFIERMKDLELWPFKTEKERKAAWKKWKAYAVYLVGL